MFAINPYIEASAKAWHAAEHGEGKWATASERERAEAFTRAQRVLDGEVRWSETGAGDRAIWDGRSSNSRRAKDRATAVLRAIAAERGKAGDYVDIIWWKLYDTAHVSEKDGYQLRLFGNANVGNTSLTDMIMAGAMPHHYDFFASDMYVTLRVSDLSNPGLVKQGMDWIETAVARLMIDHRQFAVAHVRDLLDRVPVDVLIRSRSSFEVSIEGYKEAPIVPFSVVVHLDGALCRSLV